MSKALLNIPHDARGIFKNRKNRFLGTVEHSRDGSSQEVHIRDPGRLDEILYKGNEVLLKRAENENRKTDWSLLAGRVKEHWVFVNSGYHRAIAEEILEDEDLSPFGDIDWYEAEKKLDDSRIDFLLRKDDKKVWVEVKGCTLAKDKVALFPDAPTERGTRHVEELTRSITEEGTSAALLFLVFRPDPITFEPNKEKDPGFTSAFKKGLNKGLDVHAIRLAYTGSIIEYRGSVPLSENYRKL
ncbi:MAG: DNA/RNA nuclease SfsA [Candidatus Thermoplasmatota archaeon]